MGSNTHGCLDSQLLQHVSHTSLGLPRRLVHRFDPIQTKIGEVSSPSRRKATAGQLMLAAGPTQHPQVLYNKGGVGVTVTCMAVTKPLRTSIAVNAHTIAFTTGRAAPQASCQKHQADSQLPVHSVAVSGHHSQEVQ